MREIPAGDPSRAMDLARDEALAAYAVATDPNCKAELAVPHLVRAWSWFYVAVERELPPADPHAIATWVRKQCRAAVGQARGEAAGDFVEAYAAANTELAPLLPTDEATVTEHLAILRDRIDGERRRAGQLPPAYSRRGLWARRAATWGGIGLAAFMIALRPWQWEGIGSWRGAYYPGDDLTGEPDVRRDADVDFEWGLIPPTESIPSDRFGAQWDTCMVLEQDEEITFQLIADDGAKLIIDGDDVIDLWEPEVEEMPAAEGATHQLDAGVHHVRVEYREDDEEAEVHLLATFDPAVPPEPIPARLLQYPGEELDEEDPCGGVR